jgi:citrate lyase subunit beta/citryl-CoA lyase
VVVRVNGLGTPWGRDDVHAVAGTGADAVLFPKIESAAQVRDAVAALDAAGGPASLPVWIMAETPRAILSIEAIAAAHPRIAVIVMGTSDLAKELRVRHTADRVGLVAALSQCVLAARAHGLDILDGVHLDLDDDAGFRRACEQGEAMGFDGKTLIHPKQIGVANEVFAPGAQEVEAARRILAAWKKAREEGKGIVVVDGKLVENLHADEARRTLAMHEAILALAG